jgi:hypothetical protein
MDPELMEMLVLSGATFLGCAKLFSALKSALESVVTLMGLDAWTSPIRIVPVRLRDA